MSAGNRESKQEVSTKEGYVVVSQDGQYMVRGEAWANLWTDKLPDLFTSLGSAHKSMIVKKKYMGNQNNANSKSELLASKVIKVKVTTTVDIEFFEEKSMVFDIGILK